MFFWYIMFFYSNTRSLLSLFFKSSWSWVMGSRYVSVVTTCTILLHNACTPAFVLLTVGSHLRLTDCDRDVGLGRGSRVFYSWREFQV
jgi:hypothetical protein